MALRDRWTEASGLDRTIIIASLLFVVVGFLSRPAWRTVRPRLAATLAYQADPVSDPWGSTWQKPDNVRIHSPGPNRTYEQGGGDDILLLGSASAEPYLYWITPWALILLGLSVGLTYRLARGEERTGFGDEVGRAVFTAVPLGVYALAVVIALSVDRGPHPPVIDRLALDTVSPIPTPILLTGLAYVCSVMFTLAVRMSQPELTVPQDYAYYVGHDAPTSTGNP